MYKFGKRSLQKLSGVNQHMIDVMKHALSVSTRDFNHESGSAKALGGAGCARFY